MEGEETGSTAESGGTGTQKALTAKYYSLETTSSGVHLPKYEPLHMTLTVNGTPITADENGVYHAYVGGTDDDVLTVSCQTENVTYKVTRMDTTGEIAQETGGTYKIPTFEGSLMLKIDGIVENNSATDVTSVFLLVSRDETPPVLTLSDPVFFADRDTGEYTVTGTADAGSPVVNYAMDLADVSGDAYYAEAVRWALSQGITTGTADGRFAPDATCTRAQGMTFLFRASKASADGAPAFSDVAADAYYAEAVKWATDNGITNGTTSSTFSPGSGCTRAQIVTFLWRLYAEK